MQFVAALLGVGCDFCHVEGAFEKDDKKEKQTARKTMQMMFAINQDNFEGRRDAKKTALLNCSTMWTPSDGTQGRKSNKSTGARR